MKNIKRKKNKAHTVAKRNQKANRNPSKLKSIKNIKELNKLLKQIKNSHKRSTLALLRIYTTKNWAELGYTSFKEFIVQRLPQENYEAVLSRVTSAEVMFDLGGELAVGVYSLSSSRVIKTVQGDNREKLWLELLEKSKESPTGELTPDWLTASRVKEVIEALFGDEFDGKDNPTSDGSSENESDDSIESENSTNEGMNNHQSVIQIKSNEIKTSSPQKSVPPSAIEINEADKKVATRVSKCNSFQRMLDEYDGSEPLEKLISEYSAKNFTAKNLIKMMKVMVNDGSFKNEKRLKRMVLELKSNLNYKFGIES